MKYSLLETYSVLFVIVIAMMVISMRDNTKKVQVRIIIDDFGWSELIGSPVVDEIDVKLGDNILVYRYKDRDNIQIRILEVKSDTVVVELTLSGMYPKTKYTSEVDDKDFWNNETTTYIDEIQKNKCYEIRTCTLDGAIVVYLTFEIEESEKHLRCGHGKALFAWYDNGVINVSITRDNRVKPEYDRMMKAIEARMTSEDILEYLNANDCGNCLKIVIVDVDVVDEYGYTQVRIPTEEEEETIKKFYSQLPYCK